MGLIHDIPTCAELFARIESEADSVLSSLTKSVKGTQVMKSNL